MSELGANNPVLLLVIGVLIGALLGAFFYHLFDRSKSGGRTVDDVQREMDDYKEEVGKHFAVTSELFKDMTEKYRDVYNHLASGSQALCEDAMDSARLEFTAANTLAADETPEGEAQDTVDEVEVSGEALDDAAGTADAASDEVASVAEAATSDQPKRDDPPLGV